MELKLLKLAVERLYDQLEKLTSELDQLKQEMAELHQVMPESVAIIPVSTSLADEYMDAKEVQRTLGVCYNTLRAIVGKGYIKPIRINQRRIRYSKADVIKYLQSERK